MTSEELHQARQQRCPPLGADGIAAFIAAVGYATFAAQPPWDVPVLESLAPPELAAALAAELESAIAVHAVCEVEGLGPALVYMPRDLFADAYLCRAGRLPAGRRDLPAAAGRPARPPALPHASPLAAEIAARLWAAPPRTASQLRDAIGPQRTSILAILAAGRELTRELQMLRIGGSRADPLWAPASFVFPELRPAVEHTSRDTAAAALVSKFLWLMVAATEDDVAAFFGPLFSLSRLRGLLGALVAAGALLPASVDGRPGFQVAPGA